MQANKTITLGDFHNRHYKHPLFLHVSYKEGQSLYKQAKYKLYYAGFMVVLLSLSVYFY